MPTLHLSCSTAHLIGSNVLLTNPQARHWLDGPNKYEACEKLTDIIMCISAAQMRFWAAQMRCWRVRWQSTSSTVREMLRSSWIELVMKIKFKMKVRDYKLLTRLTSMNKKIVYHTYMRGMSLEVQSKWFQIDVQSILQDLYFLIHRHSLSSLRCRHSVTKDSSSIYNWISWPWKSLLWNIYIFDQSGHVKISNNQYKIEDSQIASYF